MFVPSYSVRVVVDCWVGGEGCGQRREGRMCGEGGKGVWSREEGVSRGENGRKGVWGREGGRDE